VIVCTAIVLATFAGSGTAAVGSSRPHARLVTIAIPAPHGEIASKWLSYPGPPRADVLLPAGYDPHRRYPLLVLLHGLDGEYSDYANNGVTGMIAATHLNAIVVMPEGASGWYTDWWNDGARGNPSWESYELDTVLPTVLARYPIRPQRRWHAIAGISMGGLGATYLGGRLPGFFGTVATLSGFVDLSWFSSIVEPGMGFVSLSGLKGNRNRYAVDGPPEAFYFKGHDPTQLAVNLRHTRLFESTGTGIPSKSGLTSPDQLPQVGVGSLLEAPIIYPMNVAYHRALVAAHDHVTYRVHRGGHDIPDFYNQIRDLLAWGLFKPVASHPATWTNRTVATHGRLWGIGYHFATPPGHVVRFHQAGRTLSISAAKSRVTIRTKGCVFHLSTPAKVRLPARHCS
jgi:S-formylglutathione hydrolase FrmB